MKKSVKFSLITLGILTVWSGIYFVLIPQVLSSEFVRTGLEKEILQKSGFSLTLNDYKFRTGLAPVIRFQAQNLTLKNNEKNEFLIVKNINTKINWLALLTGRLSIKNLDADNINLALNEDYTELLTRPDVIKLIKHITVKNTLVHTLNVNLKNQKLIDDIKVTGRDILVEKFDLNKHLKLNTELLIEEKNNSGEVKLTADVQLPLDHKSLRKSTILADIEHFNLSAFSKFIHTVNPEIETLNGLIDLNINKDFDDFFSLNLISDKLFVKFKGKDLPISHTAPIQIKSLLTLENDEVIINSFKIESEKIKSSMLGTINIKNPKNPDLNLSLSIDKSNAQEIIKLLPPERDLMPELNFYALKKHYFDGDVLAHLEITGKALRPQLTGSVLITNAYLVKPIKNAQKATIRLVFNREKMTLETTVPTSPKERVWANGVFELYDEKLCDLNVKSTKNINLETAQVVVNPLQEILKIDFGPVPLMKITGLGNIDIQVHGNTIDPHITGAFNFKNAQVAFTDMPNLIIKNGEGNLKFLDTDTYFKTTKATLNSEPVNIEGSCTLQGVFNFFANSKGQNLAKLLADIKGNTLLADMNTYFDQIETIKGFGDLNLNIYGEAKDIRNIEFNKNIFSKGKITLNAVTIKPKAIPQAVSNIFGDLNLDNQDINMDLYALINKSKVTIEGKIKDSDANILVSTKDFRIIDGISTLPIELQKNILTILNSNEFINLIPAINTHFTAKYKGSIEKISPENLEVYGSLYSNLKPAEFKKVNYELVNSTLKISPVRIKNKDFHIDATATVSNLFDEKASLTGVFNLRDFNLNLINVKTLKNIKALKPLCANLENLSGKINIISSIQNNDFTANCSLQNVKIQERSRNHEILSGKVQLKNNLILADSINARIFDMPVLLNGRVSLSNKNVPTFHLWLNTKPTQDFVNTCFNQKALYPIKIKGDITLNAEISGTPQDTNIKSNLMLDKDSSIYYMGATLGDKLNAVRLTSNLTLRGNELKINNFNYDKVILSLDKNENIVPLLNISGGMQYKENNLIGFNNLKIKSRMPVDAKIFNIIFRKPFMKEGTFTSDLTLNGTSLKPHILGKLNITDINIPLVETNINNINLDFTPRVINIISSGDLLTNKIKFNAALKNELTLPLIVDNMALHVAKLDLNKINDKIKNLEESNFKMHAASNVIQPLDYTNIIVNNSKITADTIVINNINAENFTSDMQIGKDKTLNVKNFNFELAQGNVNGNITHNYLNDTVKLNINLNKANAAQMAETLFNIKGQIYGLANGKMSLSCTAKNDKTCFATLNGSGNFAIENGKMPKLGSLEYLLKAGNLISNGLTGLTINGLIDLLSPLKSGEFKTISGDFKINNGVADNINIYSSGKDLNLYIRGKYNLSTSIADFQIFGSLSKDVTTLINKVKNLSLNTLLKTIPGVKKDPNIEFTSDIAKIPNSNDRNNIYKFFRVIINGDINGEDFVKSFEWVD